MARRGRSEPQTPGRGEREGRAGIVMNPGDGQQPPDVEQLARSMLYLHGAHDDHDHQRSGDAGSGSWAKAPDFADAPATAAAVAEATRRDRERYLNEGLTQVDCRFCHASVAVKKLGTGYTAVQWNSGADRKSTRLNSSHVAISYAVF